MTTTESIRAALAALQGYGADQEAGGGYETKDVPALPYEIKDMPFSAIWLGSSIPSGATTSISRKAAAPRVADESPAERDSISPERWQRLKRNALIADVKRILDS